MCGACIPGEERVGAEHDRGVHAVDQLGHGAVVQRRGVEIDRHTGDERQDGAGGQPEGVEHRQYVEQLVLAAEIDARGSLRAVRQHVAMRQHHALGRALGARSEQDRGGIIRLARHDRLLVGEQAPQLVGGRHGRAHVLEIDDGHGLGELRHHRVELALLNEGARRDYRAHLRGLAGRKDVGGTGREVDHRGDPAP